MEGGARASVIGTVLTVLLLASSPASAQVHVDIGIHLPTPPALVVVSEVRAVRYAPQVSANLFFYSGQYWAFSSAGWYVSTGYNGPWIVVGPAFVPRPLLLVPVRYYRMPPGHWKQWNRREPPRWGHEWGPGWAAKRDWDGRGAHGGGPRGGGHGRGHGRGR